MGWVLPGRCMVVFGMRIREMVVVSSICSVGCCWCDADLLSLVDRSLCLTKTGVDLPPPTSLGITCDPTTRKLRCIYCFPFSAFPSHGVIGYFLPAPFPSVDSSIHNKPHSNPHHHRLLFILNPFNHRHLLSQRITSYPFCCIVAYPATASLVGEENMGDAGNIHFTSF